MQLLHCPNFEKESTPTYLKPQDIVWSAVVRKLQWNLWKRNIFVREAGCTKKHKEDSVLYRKSSWSAKEAHCGMLKGGEHPASNDEERECIASSRLKQLHQDETKISTVDVADLCRLSVVKRELALLHEIIFWVCKGIFWQNVDEIEKVRKRSVSGVYSASQLSKVV